MTGDDEPGFPLDDRGGHVDFEPTPEGLVVSDRIEHRVKHIETDVPVSPTTVDTAAVPAPVTGAVAIEARTLRFDRVRSVYVWPVDGPMIDTVQTDRRTFDRGRYRLQIGDSVVIYLVVEGELTVDGTERTTVTVEGDAPVVVAARSLHRRPSATVTTTDAVEDLMAAVSTFGSALKTTSPERSWPTMRGHPPAVELGERLSVPDVLAPPADGLRIEVPERPGAVYAVAPLSYYLGCRVVPGARPRLVADTGWSTPLDDPDLPTGVERALARTLLLDAVVRTEGLFRLDQHEGTVLAEDSAVDLDPGACYDQPQARRLERYFAVPNDALAPHVPDWTVVTYLDPVPGSATVLPHLVDELAVVRPGRPDRGGDAGRQREPDPNRSPPDAAAQAAVDNYLRQGPDPTAPLRLPDADRVVELPDSDAVETAWFGDGVAVGGSTVVPAAYEHARAREPTTGTIEVALVCTDRAMGSEIESVDAVYEGASDLPFDVDTYWNPTREELAGLLRAGPEFLHYAGHATTAGLQCADGWLDVRGMETVGVDAFLLNACRSYEQGLALVEAGAIGGVVTLDDVSNDGATAMGEPLAALLDAGYTLRVALDVLDDRRMTSARYSLIGYGGHAIGTNEGAMLERLSITRTGDDTFELRVRTYPKDAYGVGSVARPFVDGAPHFLLGTETPPFELSGSELDGILSNGNVAVFVEDELCWSGNLNADDFR